MKNFLFVLGFIFLTASICSAQDYKKFRVGLGFGYGVPSGNGSKGGVIFTLEPSYRLNDNLSLGLRLESALLARGYSGSTGSDFSFDVASIGSTTVNGQYYFGNNKFRPFAGLGLGIYSVTGVSTSVDLGSGPASVNVAAAESKFGFYPRVGFDLGHFSMSLDYNIVGSTKVDPQVGDGDIKNNYMGIRLGFFFGGGKKS